MQTRYNNLEELHGFLIKMKGIEYDVIHANAEPRLCFVIRKQKRMSTTDIVPMAVYYIVEGTIYQAPDFYSVLGSRMMTSLFHLDQAFNILVNAYTFQPFKCYAWKEGKKRDMQTKRISTFGNIFNRWEIHEMRQRIENLVTYLGTVQHHVNTKRQIPKTYLTTPDMDAHRKAIISPQQITEDKKDSKKRKK
jgi:hypothetical protein